MKEKIRVLIKNDILTAQDVDVFLKLIVNADIDDIVCLEHSVLIQIKEIIINILNLNDTDNIYEIVSSEEKNVLEEILKVI